MVDSPNKYKASSVAAFLIMPQFNLCFQHLSFIVPVFMRTIAVMFEQAGLLPKGHLATQYGAAGVRKYKFFELMGEAYYNLRATKGTVPQWSIFSAVVMMAVFTVLSVLVFFMNAAGIVMGVAHAQIFDSLKGADATAMTTVPSGTGTMFSNAIPPASNGHGDYAIMVLDKILRQGAMARGGVLQDSLSGLIQIYNTGMLVIAGFMILWSIIAIVTDTAKTGHLGGQRHNMVWGPIRIVFGLGLLIPLGTSGFSSGQFMIMKIAEWGSNFGTRGWVQYVQNVKDNTSMLVEVNPNNMSGLVNQYVRMWVCQQAYNAYTAQAVGGTPNARLIVKQIKNSSSDPGQQSFSFTNRTDGNLCGTLTYATENDRMLQVAATAPSSDPVTKAAANYKIRMRKAYGALFAGTGGPATPGILGAPAQGFADAFVALHIPVTAGSYPPVSTFENMVKTAYDHVKAASDAGRPDLLAVMNDTNKSKFMKDLEDRGWAGMGIWYHRIQSVNTTIMSMQEPSVSIAQGVIMNMHDKDRDDGLKANVRSADYHKAKTNEVISKYEKWWQTVPAADGAGGTNGDVLIAPKKDAEGLWSAIKSLDSDRIWSALAAAFAPPFPMFNAMNDTYPLTYLAGLGNTLLGWAFAMYAISASILGSVGALPFVGGAGAAIAASGLFAGLLSTIAASVMLAGVLLAFWIPILPFIRVAFAVLTWMIAVFEAVIMIPVAALTHISTEGEGMGGQVRGVWILWLNILLRPILTVVGYVGAIIIFNTFVVFFTDAFRTTVLSGLEFGTFKSIVAYVVYTVVYAGVIYMAANSIFKLLDVIPHAVAKYMGGHADTSFDQDASGMAGAVGRLGQSMGDATTQSARGYGQHKRQEKAEAEREARENAKWDARLGKGDD